MGASGLVLHVGSHKGSGFADCLPQVVDALGGVLERFDGPSPDACPILLENAAGTGGTVGRSFEELAAILDAAGAALAPRLGVCLDTQHLWASGIGYTSVEEADDVVADFDAVIGLDRLRCLHLNDSKVELGANRDRHANVGEGTIGALHLGLLLSHPALVDLPAILEVPGDGDGARASDIRGGPGGARTGSAGAAVVSWLPCQTLGWKATAWGRSRSPRTGTGGRRRRARSITSTSVSRPCPRRSSGPSGS